MLKWVDCSTPKCESWKLVWESPDAPHTGLTFANVYNARDEITGKTTGKWCMEWLGKFEYLHFAKDANHAKHLTLANVILMANAMSEQAGDMVLEMARNGT